MKRMASRYMTILPITRRRFWQRLRRCVAKLVMARIIAVLEPRSNTMKMGICKDNLAPSLGRADEAFLLQPAHIPWQVAEVAEACVQPAHWSGDVDTLADMVVKTAKPGDHILVMSNGGFGGIHQKLLDGLAKKAEAAQ